GGEDLLGRRSDPSELALRLGAARDHPPALHGLGALGEDVALGIRVAVVRLEEDPLLLVARLARADEVPLAHQLLPPQPQVEVALLALLRRLARRDRIVGAAVPDQRIARAV